MAKLEDETGAVSGMADALRRRLMDELPGFGRHLGYDGKAVGSHSTGREDAKSGKTSDPDADWGKHETRGADRRTGRAWTKVKTWFGYGLHLIADVEHEIPVWFEVTKASLTGAVGGSRTSRSWRRGARTSAPTGASTRSEEVIRGAAADRRAGDVAGGEGDAGLGPGILRALAKDGGGNVLHSEKGEGSAAARRRGRSGDGVPGLRGGPGEAEVPLSGGRLRPGVRGPRAKPARRRREGRRLRARGAHSAQGS